MKDLALVRAQERGFGDTGDHCFGSGLVSSLFSVDLGPGAATLLSPGSLGKSLFSWFFGLGLFFSFGGRKSFWIGKSQGRELWSRYHARIPGLG